MTSACYVKDCTRPVAHTWKPTGEPVCHTHYVSLWRSRDAVPSSRMHLDRLGSSRSVNFRKRRCPICGEHAGAWRFDCWEDEGDKVVLKQDLFFDGLWFRGDFHDWDYAAWCGGSDCQKELDGEDQQQAQISYLIHIIRGLRSNRYSKAMIPDLVGAD